MTTNLSTRLLSARDHAVSLLGAFIVATVMISAAVPVVVG